MVRCPRWLGGVAAGLVLLNGGLLPAAGKGPITAARLFPGGGVLDPAGKVGYVPNPGGGIDALDLDTGALLWSTDDASRPLLATDERLFAQADVKGRANQVRVVVLDAGRKGKRLLESEPVTFPEWVSVGVAYGRSFQSAAYLGRGSLFLAWAARAWYAGGAAPPPELERAARKAASGVARIDLASGRVETLQGDQVPGGVSPQGAGEPQTVKVGERVYSTVDRPAGKPGRSFLTERTLKAEDASGKVIWQRAIRAPVHLIPLP